jgi:hypothetical protein
MSIEICCNICRHNYYCTGIFLIGIDMCPIDICVFIEKHKSKTLDMAHK